LRVGATRQHLIETQTELRLGVGCFALFWVVHEQRVADVESRRALWPRRAEGAWCGRSNMSMVNSVSFKVGRTYMHSPRWRARIGVSSPAHSRIFAGRGVHSLLNSSSFFSLTRSSGVGQSGILSTAPCIYGDGPLHPCPRCAYPDAAEDKECVVRQTLEVMAVVDCVSQAAV
jgi:hypothetical protein